jgi:hypothetical protein
MQMCVWHTTVEQCTLNRTCSVKNNCTVHHVVPSASDVLLVRMCACVCVCACMHGAAHTPCLHGHMQLVRQRQDRDGHAQANVHKAQKVLVTTLASE